MWILKHSSVLLDQSWIYKSEPDHFPYSLYVFSRIFIATIMSLQKLQLSMLATILRNSLVHNYMEIGKTEYLVLIKNWPYFNERTL